MSAKSAKVFGSIIGTLFCFCCFAILYLFGIVDEKFLAIAAITWFSFLVGVIAAVVLSD